MNKKTLGIVLLVFSIILSILLFIFYKSKMNYNDIVITSEEYNNIINNRNKIDDDVLTSIKFNNYELYKASNKEDIYYSLLDNNNRRYNPTIRYLSSMSNSKIAIVDNYITEDNIKNGVKALLLIYNDKSYKEYKITFTTLPIMNINYDSSIELSDTIKNKMNMYLYDNQEMVINRMVFSDGEMKIKGKLTDNPKKSYSISLKRDSLGHNKRKNEVSLLGLRKDNNYVLLSLTNDQEKVREVLASRIWYDGSAKQNEFDLINGTYYKYIELFINNEYQGLYALGFPIDEMMLNLHTDRNGVYDEFTYKRVDNTGTITDYELKDGVNSITSSSMIDEFIKSYNKIKNKKDLTSLMDYENIIDTFLFIQLINGVDNIDDNMYVTLKNKNGHIKSVYTPGNLSVSFGNLKDNELTNEIKPYAYRPEYFMNLLDRPLLRINNPTVVQDIKNRYSELRKTTWSLDNITNYINEYEEDIYLSGAFIRDKNRYPEGMYSNEADGLNNLRNYMEKRLTAFDKYIENL